MTTGDCTFRVVLSSTFADLKSERDALAERVFPRLRALCRDQGTVLDAIASIARGVGLGPTEVPCLDLPDAAWDDERLRGACPQCGSVVIFNPFAVDASAADERRSL